ncbi:unnamed protein product [Owenia fusiformis]|uniref:Uncharacterized protein n=1 Tax=Owenia fusiformis TaxID=6347 RepID=A0A8J1UL40_OWEFU|nr:unnamed protein product [Owenia fusiformis]
MQYSMFKMRACSRRMWLKCGLTIMLLGFVGSMTKFFWNEETFDTQYIIGTNIEVARSTMKLEKLSIPGYDDDTDEYFKSVKDTNYIPINCPINITLFTVFHEGLRAKEVLQNNTLLNWMQLQRHCIRPVFYSNNSVGILAGKKYHGWQHHPLSANMIARNNVILRELFSETFKRHNSDFYMFAYADLLFHGDSLLKTLSAVKNYVQKAKLEYFIISGSRYEVPFYNSRYKITKKLRIGDDIEIENIQLERKPLHISKIEYFITTKDSFPWDVVPDLVVTTLAPDPLPAFWFPMYANKLGIATFDISRSISPLRQAGLMPNIMDREHRMATKLNTFVFIKSFTKYCLYKPVIHSHVIPQISTLNCFKLRTLQGKDGSINVENSMTYSDNECKYRYPIMIPMLERDENFWDIL